MPSGLQDLHQEKNSPAPVFLSKSVSLSTWMFLFVFTTVAKLFCSDCDVLINGVQTGGSSSPQCFLTSLALLASLANHNHRCSVEKQSTWAVHFPPSFQSLTSSPLSSLRQLLSLNIAQRCQGCLSLSLVLFLSGTSCLSDSCFIHF